MFNSGMKKRVGLAGTLLLCQGLLGWYMVKSGRYLDRMHGHRSFVLDVQLIEILIQRWYSTSQSLAVFYVRLVIRSNLSRKSRYDKKIYKKYIGKIDDIFFTTKLKIFFCKMLLIPYNNVYYNQWNLIIKFWLGSTKWNTPLASRLMNEDKNSVVGIFSLNIFLSD